MDVMSYLNIFQFFFPQNARIISDGVVVKMSSIHS